MFDAKVPLDMEPVLGAGCECPRAEIAPEGSVSSVDPNMLLKISLLTERLCAIRTLERLLSLMPSYVSRQTGAMLELLTTLITEELGVCIMNSQVGAKITRGLE